MATAPLPTKRDGNAHPRQGVPAALLAPLGMSQHPRRCLEDVGHLLQPGGFHECRLGLDTRANHPDEPLKVPCVSL